ncbi:hypothetical protein LshimejAT787_1204650 [Lyophyllum shimeji]|uniref:Uncharacterized protein n=1 Tax=Lyophyllum shimeji TaxID=47721 RepID=A0A9P3UUB9_LYOSH|nr:hypothetical protein LshimejAT787_1204650 [Lyophyllum shimeji]
MGVTTAASGRIGATMVGVVHAANSVVGGPVVIADLPVARSQVLKPLTRGSSTLATSKVTTTSGSAINFSFNGTGVWLYAKQSTYTVVFQSNDNYLLTPRNVTGDCDIGWSRDGLPYNEYHVSVFPNTDSGPFELLSVSVQQLDKYAVESTPTMTSTSATRTPTQSSSASRWKNSSERVACVFATVMLAGAL